MCSGVIYSAWAGCIAGTLTDKEYRVGLAAAGFVGIELEVTRRYQLADVPSQARITALGPEVAAELVGRFGSTFVRVMKPAIQVAALYSRSLPVRS